MTINKEQPVSDAIERVETGSLKYRNGNPIPDSEMVLVRASDIRIIIAAASHPLEQQQAVSGDVVERLSQQIANAMQRARAECGGDRVSFAYAEAAMRSELRAALTASGMGRMRAELSNLLAGIDDSLWHQVKGERMKRIYVAESAIERIRTALQEEGVERRD